MRENPQLPYLVACVVIWAVMGVGMRWWIGSTPDVKEKKRRFDRGILAAGIFVGGNMCLVMAGWREYILIPVFAVILVIIGYLSRRYTRFCGQCGKISQRWSKRGAAVRCPNCWAPLE